MKIIHLEQAGPDWHRWRSQGIGGSDACAVMGDVAWTSPDELAAAKRTGQIEPENEAMAASGP
jgi:predicted phage-related endonuclease